MTTDVLGVQDKETVWIPAPEMAVTTGEFVALLATVTLPVTLPLDDGSKVTVSVAACPADKISPADMPSVTKPAPETMTLEIVMSEFPALTSVTLWLAELDIATLPKLNAGELELSGSGAIPVSLTLT